MATKNEMKEEALARMKELHLLKEVQDDFEKNGRVWLSDYQGKFFPATLYYIDDSQEQDVLAEVKKFEKRTGNLVYHVIRTPLSFGVCLSLLYVDKNENYWNGDRKDLKDKTPYVYVVNLDEPLFSEGGCIGIEKVNGGLERTA